LSSFRSSYRHNSSIVSKPISPTLHSNVIQEQSCMVLSRIYFFALVTILFPAIFMLTFGLMTIANVRKTQSRLPPMSISTNTRIRNNSAAVGIAQLTHRKKSDCHLLLVLFIQVLLMSSLDLPLAISKFYSTITRNVSKSTLQITTENFIFNLFLLLMYAASGMPFYIYTLNGGSVFRRALFNLFEILR
jgi:hypothetical protein